MQELLINNTQDIRDLFRDHIKEKGHIMKWVADKANINYWFLYSILRKDRVLNEENRIKLNNVLNTNY